jgi:hypothetical protein
MRFVFEEARTMEVDDSHFHDYYTFDFSPWLPCPTSPYYPAAFPAGYIGIAPMAAFIVLPFAKVGVKKVIGTLTAGGVTIAAVQAANNRPTAIGRDVRRYNNRNFHPSNPQREPIPTVRIYEHGIPITPPMYVPNPLAGRIIAAGMVTAPIAVEILRLFDIAQMFVETGYITMDDLDALGREILYAEVRQTTDGRHVTMLPRQTMTNAQILTEKALDGISTQLEADPSFSAWRQNAMNHLGDTNPWTGGVGTPGGIHGPMPRLVGTYMGIPIVDMQGVLNSQNLNLSSGHSAQNIIGIRWDSQLAQWVDCQTYAEILQILQLFAVSDYTRDGNIYSIGQPALNGSGFTTRKYRNGEHIANIHNGITPASQGQDRLDEMLGLFFFRVGSSTVMNLAITGHHAQNVGEFRYVQYITFNTAAVHHTPVGIDPEAPATPITIAPWSSLVDRVRAEQNLESLARHIVDNLVINEETGAEYVPVLQLAPETLQQIQQDIETGVATQPSILPQLIPSPQTIEHPQPNPQPQPQPNPELGTGGALEMRQIERYNQAERHQAENRNFLQRMWDGLWGWLSRILDAITSLPGLIATAIVGDMNVNLEPLQGEGRAQLTSVFPFSIPFDIGAMLGTFFVAPQTPVFTMDLSDTILSFVWELDFARFETLATIIRWGVLISFSIGLAMISSSLIRW